MIHMFINAPYCNCRGGLPLSWDVVHSLEHDHLREFLSLCCKRMNSLKSSLLHIRYWDLAIRNDPIERSLRQIHPSGPQMRTAETPLDVVHMAFPLFGVKWPMSQLQPCHPSRSDVQRVFCGCRRKGPERRGQSPGWYWYPSQVWANRVSMGI